MTTRSIVLGMILLGLAVAHPAAAGEGLELRLDGQAVVLRDGLQRSADGKVWITTADLVDAFGVTIRRLIPRPAEGTRARPRDQRDPWVLCGPDACSPYDGELRDASTEPAFDLARVTRMLGHRLRVRGDVHDVLTAVAPARAPTQARVGYIIPPRALTFRDGTRRTLRDAAPKRLLLVTWAPWSPSRDDLEEWSAFAAMRRDKDLMVWFVAVDVEGEPRVKDYAAPAGDLPIALDRRAELARVLSLQDVGRWYLIDDLGVLRAEGARLDEASRYWIDLHLEERVTTRPRAPAAPITPEPLAVLRERVAAEPASIPARLALLDALGDAERAEAIVQAQALLALQPKAPPFAFRLAALHLDAGDTLSALAVLEAARREAPNSWYLRKQYWALLEPLRYYAGPIDVAWERAKRKEEALDGRRRGTRR